MPGPGRPDDRGSPPVALGEIYLEIHQVGKAQRITAIDPETALEVVFTAPINSPRSEIETLARNKLSARVARERAKAARTAPPAATQRGRLV